MEQSVARKQEEESRAKQATVQMEALLQKQREAMAEREAIEKEHETAVLKEKLRAQIAAKKNNQRPPAASAATGTRSSTEPGAGTGGSRLGEKDDPAGGGISYEKLLEMKKRFEEEQKAKQLAEAKLQKKLDKNVHGQEWLHQKLLYQDCAEYECSAVLI